MQETEERADMNKINFEFCIASSAGIEYLTTSPTLFQMCWLTKYDLLTLRYEMIPQENDKAQTPL